MRMGQRTALAYLTMALSLVACVRTFVLVRSAAAEEVLLPATTHRIAFFFAAALLLGVGGLALLAWAVRGTWRGSWGGRELAVVNRFRSEQLLVEGNVVAEHKGFGGRVTLRATIDGAEIVAAIGGVLLVDVRVTANGEVVPMREAGQ